MNRSTFGQIFLQLYGFERDGGTKSDFWQGTDRFSRAGGQQGSNLDEKMSAFQKSKRKFTREELLNTTWVKVSNRGNATILSLFPDGKLTEEDVVESHRRWEGNWELLDGILRLHIGGYTLTVMGNAKGRIHSGVEHQGSQTSDPWAYQRLVPLAVNPMLAPDYGPPIIPINPNQ